MSNNNLINSETILELQKYLINLRNIYPSLLVIYPTGIYDNDTRNDVSEFQMIKGLPTTGVVDINTWNEIIFENEQYLKKTQPPKSVMVSPAAFEDVKVGDTRDIVYAIKVMLSSMNKKYANYHELEISNLYDEKTKKAVELFQERSMLPVTGIVDVETWNTLVAIYGGCKFYR